MICLSGFIMTTKSGSDCKISHRRSGGSKGEAVEYILDISAQGQAAERCSGPAYQLFLDYAFTQADFFMLAFVNYYGKGLPARARQARAQLAPFRVRSRTNPSWPGTPETCCPNTTYKINVYRCCDAAKQVLQAADRLSDWSRPKNARIWPFSREANAGFTRSGTNGSRPFCTRRRKTCGLCAKMAWRSIPLCSRIPHIMMPTMKRF